MNEWCAVDHLFAKTLFRRAGMTPTHQQQTLIEKAFASARMGSLCMEIKESEAALCGALINETQAKEEEPVRPLCQWGKYLYLRRHWVLETRIVQALHDLSERAQAPSLDLEKAEALSEEQQTFLNAFSSSFFTILSGGPGRGKTHTAACLVKKLPAAWKVLVTAPTGKATAQLAEKIRAEGAAPEITAQTLHAFLGRRGRNLSHDFDLIIVDEASMVDARIFAGLLQSVGKRARLLLLGDEQQLPSVEAGNVFAEICRAAQKHGRFAYVHLTRCFRTDRKEILDFAESVFEPGSTLTPSGEGVKVRSFEALPARYLIDLARRYFVLKPEDLHLASQHFLKFRFLSALKVGPYGTDAINRFIFEWMSQSYKEFIVPIIITKTDYELGIFNGEMGYKIGDQAFIERGGGHFQKLSIYAIESYDWAYAVSVHKSQGSEYDHVALFLPDGCSHFGRQMLYTGITRTKKYLELIADPPVIASCLNAQNERISAIEERLSQGDQ